MYWLSVSHSIKNPNFKCILQCQTCYLLLTSSSNVDLLASDLLIFIHLLTHSMSSHTLALNEMACKMNWVPEEKHRLEQNCFSTHEAADTHFPRVGPDPREGLSPTTSPPSSRFRPDPRSRPPPRP